MGEGAESAEKGSETEDTVKGNRNRERQRMRTSTAKRKEVQGFRSLGKTGWTG